MTHATGKPLKPDISWEAWQAAMAELEGYRRHALSTEIAAIIRRVEPDWLPRGASDADIRNKIREWAERIA